MRIFDIENKIEQIRKISWNLSMLDIPNRYSDISIELILADIKEQTDTINDECLNDKHIKKNARKNKKIAYISQKMNILHKLERKISKNELYTKYIRPHLKIFFPNMNSKISVRLKDLLQYDDAIFVDVVYRSLLFREPDIEGKRHYITLLRNGLAQKIDIVNSLLTSTEGRQKYIKVTGLPWRLFIHRMGKAINSIPFVSYPINWITALLLLPKRIKELNDADNINRSLFFQVSDSIDSLAARIDQIENAQKLESEKNLIDTQLMNKLYFDYKNKLMNDDREEIKKKLTPYIQRVDKWVSNQEKRNLRFVDLGCGLGEWLEVLQDHGFSALGIDSNELTVNEAKRLNKNINVECSDVFAFLRKQKNNSIDIISSFHMIEHLDLNELFTLFDECKRVLSNGGLLILVTPNPQNLLTATYYFHLDPTHKNPLPVELLKFYMEEWGLCIYDTIFLNPLDFIEYDYNSKDPMKHIAYRFNIEQEYCVMAMKSL